MARSKNNEKLDKTLHFFEEQGIKLVIVPFLLVVILNKALIHFESKYGFKELDSFFINTGETLIKKDGTLITIAAVFIGIYFTVFTLLSSLRVESTFSILTEENFFKLLKYIRNAFIGSFLYLFYSLFSPLISIMWIKILISMSLLLYMLFSALRFGAIIYVIFSRDVKKYYAELEIEKIKLRKRENLEKKIEMFLDEQERTAAETYSEEFAKKNF